MVKMHTSVLKNKNTVFIALFAIFAPLFNLRIIASVTFFDVITLLAILMYFSFSSSYSIKTTLLLIFFIVISLVSEWIGLTTMNGIIDDLPIDSLNILARYLILLFIMPYLSYRLFYFGSNALERIDLFYIILMCSFFLVLIFNAYAIYFHIEGYFIYQRFCSIYGNSNTLALTLNIISVMYLYNTTHRHIVIRIVSYASIPLILLSLVMSGSYSGFLIQLIIFTMFLFKARKLKVIIFIVIAVMVALSFDYSGVSTVEKNAGFSRLLALGSMTSLENFEISEIGSFDARMIGIQSAIKAIKSNPIFIITGVGFGNVENFINIGTSNISSVHLSYLQLIISIGALGLTVYLSIFLRIYRKILNYIVDKDLCSQSRILLLVFLMLGAFIPHTYMSFYFSPIFPLLGLYSVKNNYA